MKYVDTSAETAYNKHIVRVRGQDMDALKLDTVLLSGDRSCLEILDQTLLPGTVKVLRVEKIEDIFEAIRFLRVRGAPAIGVCAAYGIALTASRIETQDYGTFLSAFREQKNYLASARPTAVNLFWALDRMEQCWLACGPNLPRLVEEARNPCPAASASTETLSKTALDI